MSADFQDIGLPEAPPVPEGAMFDQASIDALFGDDMVAMAPKQGLKAVIESKIISHERLPMLEVACERMVRSFATSMRNLTSDAIDVSLEDLSSARFGDFINGLALPAMIGVFHVREWENYGLVTVDSALIYAVVDALLGGRRGGAAMRIDGRAFTTIETNLVSRMLDLALVDLAAAFGPISPVTLRLDRIETNPRFAAIARPSNIAAVASFRVDMEGRGGRFSLVLPYATMEPIRDKLLQRFMGEKAGRGNIWEAHMAAELRKTEVAIDVVLGARSMMLGEVRSLRVGQTIRLNQGPDDALELHSGGVPLGHAHIGQRRHNIAVRMIGDISKGSGK